MTLRIAIGGFLHESHSFAPRPTKYVDFLHPGGFPPLVGGPGMIPAVRPTSVASAGAIPVAEAAGATLVPLAWGFANPAGPVQDEAFERIAAMICSALSEALDIAPLDGIYLDLHGAAVSDSFPDMEGELLRRVRAIAGTTPLTISLDPHCNLTAAMVDQVDALVPYRTYPHIDMREAGAQAMRLLLERIRRGTPLARAFRQVDFFLPLTTQCTLVDPMAAVMTERAAQAQSLAELAFCFGFPYADFADCGAALAAYATTQPEADQAADNFLATINSREAQFRLDVLPAEEAVAAAIKASTGATRPVVIADTQDNPGGGGHGDTTGLLAELIRQKATGSVLALINDAESAAALHAAGTGATIALQLGGKSDNAPLAVNAHILLLTDGNFTGTGPMAKGNPAALGPSALIEVAPGIRVIVVTRKIQALDQSLLRHVGIEPADCRIIVLKSSVHFRADYGPIAETVIVAAAPGPVVADPAVLPFKNLRKGLRLRPMDNRSVA